MDTDSIGLDFHHVGLACRKLSIEMKVHEQLGYTTEGEPFYDPIQRIHGIFMKHGPMRIELLEPASVDSPVTQILKHGQKMYHQGFTCADIHMAIRQLEAHRARIISPPAPAVAFHGKEIAFLMLPTLMIIELIQL